MLFLIEDGDYEDRSVVGVFSGEDVARFDSILKNYRHLYVQHYVQVAEAGHTFNSFNPRPRVPDRPNGVKKRLWDGHPLMVEYRLQAQRWGAKWQTRYEELCAQYPCPDLKKMLADGGFTEVPVHYGRA